MALAIALSLVAIAYNNVINRWEPFHSWAYVPANLAFAGTVTAIAAVGLELSTDELGLGGDLSDLAAPVAVVAIFALGALAMAASRHAHRIADRRVAGLRGGALAYHVMVRIPVGTGVVEEVVFRGVLFAAWSTAGATNVVAALCASVAFGLWHIAPTTIGLRMNDPHVSKSKMRAVVVGAVAATAIVGLFLTWLRVRTGGLVAPIALHAGINSTGALAAVRAGAHSDR